MAATRNDWDLKHRAASQTVEAPAEIVVELLSLLPPGPALDLACGKGRHTLLLARRGQPVTAVDGSQVALHLAEEQARAARMTVSWSGNSHALAPVQSGIRLAQLDLEQATIKTGAFDLVLCVNYLQRSIFAKMERALAPGGLLLFETYTRAQLEFSGGPRSPEHLLEPGELRNAFPTLRVLFYRELRAGKGIASLVAQQIQRLRRA